VEVPSDEGLLAHVDAQAVDRVLGAGQRPGELLGVAAGLVLHEGQEEVLLVREVVVNSRAPHTRVVGDVGQGDLVEAALAHELGQRLEQGGARALSMLGQ